MTRPLFLFWQFSGTNSDLCQLHCPYCYGGPKRMIDRWDGQSERWEHAFERLNRDIYFVLGYGEVMVSSGFYPVLDVIGRHPNWETSLVTNLMVNPEKMLKMRIALDKRIYVHASWHPMGGAVWETFQKHVLMLQDANIPLIVMFLWYPPQIKDWAQYFRWLDDHNVRTCVRRFVGNYQGKPYPQSYTVKDWQFLYAQLLPKTQKYGLRLVSPEGNLCSALKDMILVAYDGRVSLCADLPDWNRGNIFDPNFKLRDTLLRCPSICCGGDYGLLHFEDEEFAWPRTDELWHDCFVAQVEQITGGGKEPVHYPDREGMQRWMASMQSSS